MTIETTIETTIGKITVKQDTFRFMNCGASTTKWVVLRDGDRIAQTGKGPLAAALLAKRAVEEISAHEDLRLRDED